MAQLAETGAGEPEKLEALRVRWLGRKQGVIRSINDNWLRSASPELKREIGQLLNALREEAERQILVVKRAEGIPMTPAPVTVTPAPVTARWSIPEPTVFVTGALDITLPGTRRAVGVRHILRRVMDEITEIFFSLGYSVEEGPDIESVYYNFEALNIPEDHPARDDQDTFYIDSRTVLRTHTSSVQIRTMEKLQPPLRIIVPGKAYRRDTPDATHSPMFHQVEGLAVDTHITFADLKGTLDYFLKAFFGPEVRTRFRPSFFPFTEPSAEVDISCLFCGARGCRICKQSGWIELMGCGMVDPALYPHVHYEASRYSGFAFGMGVERLAMLKYGVQDIQLFFQGDVRFLRQFR
ncbi:MAG: phenylalanine--tRNA ligase subunit alpha [Acidobacteria bacterium RIFCSPLOWO2_12_FULL_59_11]|nr:MAG: phenylalanine--tRNA ligase subunit alpha [Acidobacteria bacterium RIFCSPLOWO2_12_FULL_59_11]